MRTTSIAANNMSFNVTYPDAIGFAFNPCIFIVEREQLQWARITGLKPDGSGTKYFEVDYRAYNGKAIFDLREYIQAVFDDETFREIDYSQEAQRTALGKEIQFTFGAGWLTDDGTMQSLSNEQQKVSVFYVWGALKVGGEEVYNGTRKLTYFRGYPFVFSIYSSGSGALLFARDGVPNKFVNLTEQGVWNVALPDDAKTYYAISDCTGTLVETTFDTTFDLTFRMRGGGTITQKIRIEVVEGITNGIYLRWIDRHGFWCHWLFKRGAEQRKTTVSQEYFRHNLEAYDMSYGYQYGAGRRQQYNREDVLPVCAPLVDRETWDTLFDVATSPVVEMLAGYDANNVPRWMSVGVQAGSYTKEGVTLQDFAINILLPEVPLQTQ